MRDLWDGWINYWRWYGIGYGLFQAFMITVWIVSGIGMLAGLAWMTWEPWL
ncbi:hypothetical protein [Streptomyces sp. NPDC005244]|uniref:hypothetical protein n=1 Tax=Streptomyces sp. NPDC005244 TaxID=3364708 RepID=UPI0036B2A144